MKKVIICDDDRYFTEYFATLLDFEDIPCDVCNSSDEFSNFIDFLDNYSVIFLDVMLRKGDVLEDDTDLETGEFLYQVIRDKYPSVKVAIISAKSKVDINIDFKNKNTFFISKTSGGDLGEALKVIQGE